MKALRIYAWLLLGLPAAAQHQEVPAKPEMWKGKTKVTEDTTSLLHAFKAGQLHGHFRYFFMHTNNARELTDYHANAIGGGIKYETAKYKGFQFGVSGFYIYNLASSDLSKPDEKTGQPNRYEIGLFEITDPHNKRDINRLEELYLKYTWKKSSITAGNQLINTPFINLQDGRMRPTEVEGIYAYTEELKNTHIEGGMLTRISPRSTVEWYRIGESVGIYPQGVNPDGSRSDYAGNLHSRAIILADVTHKVNENLSVKLHNLYAAQLFNTSLIQANVQAPAGAATKVIAAGMYIRQQAVAHGGNADESKTYMLKTNRSHVMSARVGVQHTRWQTSLNYTRITAHGRYLMPREWGRDPFFTFLPRERNEGFGDVNAWMINADYTIPKLRLKTQVAAGYYQLPDVTNYRLNKYGMPSYTQLNVDVRHEFEGFWKGLEAQLLLVYKGKAGNAYGNGKFIINKVNMGLINLVLNYHF